MNLSVRTLSARTRAALPNALTTLRLVLAGALLALLGRPVAFVAVYLACGLTDVLDGALARRFGVASRLGARLDTVADAAVLAVSLLAVALSTTALPRPAVLRGVLVVGAVRVLTLVVTRLRHGRFAIAHTWGNKAAGLAVFAAIPVALLASRVPGALLTVVLAVCLLAALDELLLTLRTTTYDDDARGTWDLGSPREHRPHP